MKKVLYLSLIMIALIGIAASNSAAQIAPDRQLTLRVTSEALHLVGENSIDSKVGPSFGGTLGYGFGSGFTGFLESGYGWTNFQSTDGLKLVQIPVLAGMTYNFATSMMGGSGNVMPFLGVGAGVYNYMLQQDGTTLNVGGVEQKTTSFGLEGLAGVSFKVTDQVALDVRGKYDHVFSKKDNPGIESQEWNNVGIGAGISYFVPF